MSLSDRAAQAAQQRASAVAARKEGEHAAEGTFVAERVADLLGLPVTYLDSTEGDHPVKRGSGFAAYVGRDRHKIHRLLVDDVVFWWLMPTRESHDPRAGELVVERPCRSCGRPHCAKPESLARPDGYDALLTPEGSSERGTTNQEFYRKQYVSTRSAEARAGYLLAIGQALTSQPLCWDCQIGVPERCPTCGRSNEKNG